jgi:hypothetical protein
MSKTLVKLEVPAFNQAVELAERIGIPTTQYINQAVAHYNRVVKRELLAKQLAEESLLCREESMRVLAEFESEWKA